jgi:hypothetical protein
MQVIEKASLCLTFVIAVHFACKCGASWQQTKINTTKFLEHLLSCTAFDDETKHTHACSSNCKATREWLHDFRLLRKSKSGDTCKVRAVDRCAVDCCATVAPPLMCDHIP